MNQQQHHKAKGFAAHESKQPLKPFEFTRRQVGPNDVLIDIKFCGICHSDIHMVRDEWSEGTFPMVPGHEIAGIVSKVGDKVTKFKPGNLVGVGCLVDSCRSCDACRKGLENYCAKMVGTYGSRFPDGSITYGGYSNVIVVDESYVLRLPSTLPLEEVAPLLCAGITTYSPLKHWNCGPGKSVAIIGLGGLGHVALKIAKAMGAHVSVISHSDKKREDAKRLGADDFFNTSDEGTFKKLEDRFDLILNTVSAEVDFQSFVNMLSIDGAYIAIGLPEKKEMTLRVGPLIWKRRTVAGSMIGGIQETQEMLDFCEQHSIGCDVEVISIDKVNEAYDRVVDGNVKFRFVIDMSTLPQAFPVSES